eukprot:177176-Pelagomonas_calceolata.AAC.2
MALVDFSAGEITQEAKCAGFSMPLFQQDDTFCLLEAHPAREDLLWRSAGQLKVAYSQMNTAYNVNLYRAPDPGKCQIKCSPRQMQNLSCFRFWGPLNHFSAVR